MTDTTTSKQDQTDEVLQNFTDALAALIEDPDAMSDKRIRGYRHDIRLIAHSFGVATVVSTKSSSPTVKDEGLSPGKQAAANAGMNMTENQRADAIKKGA